LFHSGINIWASIIAVHPLFKPYEYFSSDFN
jgi:hypothetical protein